MKISAFCSLQKVLMKEGIVQALLQAGKVHIASGKPEIKPEVKPSKPLRIPCLIAEIFVAICDPDISMLPRSPLHW